jgi:hypothetical protein
VVENTVIVINNFERKPNESILLNTRYSFLLIVVFLNIESSKCVQIMATARPPMKKGNERNGKKIGWDINTPV